MSSFEFLQSYSEIAVTIIGFSGVVVALRGRGASDDQKITLSMLILFGSVSLVMGILPQILLEAGIDEALVWRVLSGFIFASQAVAGVLRSRQAKDRGTDISGLGGPGFAPIMLTSLALAAANIYFATFWLYMGNLLLYLLASIAIFRNLVGLGADA